jgi:hypothetical protein
MLNARLHVRAFMKLLLAQWSMHVMRNIYMRTRLRGNSLKFQTYSETLRTLDCPHRWSVLRSPAVFANGCVNTQVNEANVNYMTPIIAIIWKADETGNTSGVAIKGRESLARQCHLASFIQLARCRCPLCSPAHVTHLPRNNHLSKKERKSINVRGTLFVTEDMAMGFNITKIWTGN